LTKQLNNGLSVRFGIQDILNQSFYLLQDANNDMKLSKENDQVMQQFKRGSYFTFGIQYKFRER
jgi:hypothetical protein